MERLERLEAGMPILYGSDRMTRVPSDLADAFRAGDRLVVVQDTGDLLHIPRDVWDSAADAVTAADNAFRAMAATDQTAVTKFFDAFAARLGDDALFAEIAEANQADVAAARAAGRSVTRLELTDRMRADMVAALTIWRDLEPADDLIDTVDHGRWRVELRRAGLGVIGFVFEGRPNVFADATGVLRSGNTVVFRIGSAALVTARAIVAAALEPALMEAGLPSGAVSLVDSPSRAAGWAMFSDRRLGLAVARGSGAAVTQLGAVARQAGIPVSLHGTGGAWIITSPAADPEAVEAAVYRSLDRKVCNTLNTLALVIDGVEAHLPAALSGLERAARDRGANPKLHLVGDVDLPEVWWNEAPIKRAKGEIIEPVTESIPADRLGEEWEWEESPEITLVVVGSIDEAVAEFNRQSPRFIASLISPDPAEHEAFYSAIDAAFVGNGFTRWVDGQYALERPELGLSNWQFGRLLGRGGILSGDGIYTIRTRMVQDDPDQGR